MKPYRGALPLDELRRLYARGWSRLKIAAALGCSGPSVTYALHALGLRSMRIYRHWTAADDERLTVLWAEGQPIRDIAIRLGRFLNQVSGRRRRLGLPRRTASHRPMSQAERETIAARWGEESLRSLADDLGRHRQAINRYGIHKLGLPRRAGDRPV